MKLTEDKLRQIIREEAEKLDEATDSARRVSGGSSVSVRSTSQGQKDKFDMMAKLSVNNRTAHLNKNDINWLIDILKERLRG